MNPPPCLYVRSEWENAAKYKTQNRNIILHVEFSIVFLGLQRAWGFFDPLFSKIKLLFSNSFSFDSNFQVSQQKSCKILEMFMKKIELLIKILNKILEKLKISTEPLIFARGEQNTPISERYIKRLTQRTSTAHVWRF